MNRYSFLTFLFVVFVVLAYFLNFYVLNDQVLSDDVTHWGAFGDYIGGLVGPFLSFFALVLLIQSLNLQNQANISLREQLKNNEKTERVKSFESLFFNLIQSQKDLLDTFKLVLADGETAISMHGVEAIIKLEDEIERIRNDGGSNQDVSKLIEQVDQNDQVFNVLRAFSVLVRSVSDRLSDSYGFGQMDRRPYYSALINFTNFSQLRLVLIAAQFLDCHHSEYIKNNLEFNSVMSEFGLRHHIY